MFFSRRKLAALHETIRQCIAEQCDFEKLHHADVQVLLKHAFFHGHRLPTNHFAVDQRLTAIYQRVQRALHESGTKEPKNLADAVKKLVEHVA